MILNLNLYYSLEYLNFVHFAAWEELENLPVVFEILNVDSRSPTVDSLA